MSEFSQQSRRQWALLERELIIQTALDVIMEELVFFKRQYRYIPEVTDQQIKPFLSKEDSEATRANYQKIMKWLNYTSIRLPYRLGVDLYNLYRQKLLEYLQLNNSSSLSIDLERISGTILRKIYDSGDRDLLKHKYLGSLHYVRQEPVGFMGTSAVPLPPSKMPQRRAKWMQKPLTVDLSELQKQLLYTSWNPWTSQKDKVDRYLHELQKLARNKELEITSGEELKRQLPESHRPTTKAKADKLYGIYQQLKKFLKTRQDMLSREENVDKCLRYIDLPLKIINTMFDPKIPSSTIGQWKKTIKSSETLESQLGATFLRKYLDNIPPGWKTITPDVNRHILETMYYTDPDEFRSLRADMHSSSQIQQCPPPYNPQMKTQPQTLQERLRRLRK